MSRLDDDIRYADDILSGRNKDTFGFIYSRTNENLLRLFECIDVKDKDVYTVLSSSDIFFSVVNGVAARVDSFDINPLTCRYYHLRKWLLQYGRIDADGLSIDNLLRVVNHHLASSSIDEEESVEFWNNFLNKIDSYHFYSNILFEYIERPPVGYESRIRELVQSLGLINPKFDNIDICDRFNCEPSRKYDLVFMSNILDYDRSIDRLENACSNLLSLLNDGGSVICSHMGKFSGFDAEKELFSKSFEYSEIFTDRTDTQSVQYYQYVKR